MKTICDIPFELHNKIVNYMDLESLYNMSIVNRHFHDISKKHIEEYVEKVNMVADILLKFYTQPSIIHFSQYDINVDKISDDPDIKKAIFLYSSKNMYKHFDKCLRMEMTLQAYGIFKSFKTSFRKHYIENKTTFKLLEKNNSMLTDTMYSLYM